MFATAQGICNSLPDDTALECLHKRQLSLDKSRINKTEQLKKCVRDRLEDAPAAQIKAELEAFDEGEKIWRKQVEHNCRVHETAFYDGSARHGEAARCENRETELRTARLQELGQPFACFGAKLKTK
ncbi:lysozyme inhibitor LprI family protein [Roseateles amylovorans]|uniref:Lysozyme inhibitor LprI family protein n=1 Tax=Roseateles amylovorans TaxID=2978473 RepID=A0ABY6AT37_9BURK|nr:lysozyme inhibitor LprI family protein [Roseateles amylovorans]UXH76182.1 lysozyme inhibitor LprI family protein [Roseateles amylovorans]